VVKPAVVRSPRLAGKVVYQVDSFGTEANVYILTPYFGGQGIAGNPLILIPSSPSVTADTYYTDHWSHTSSTRVNVQYWRYGMTSADRQMVKEVDLYLPDKQSAFHVSYTSGGSN
jgi:hypothetical protein